MWVFRLAGRLNCAPQMLQRYGFSPAEPKRKGEGLNNGVLGPRDPLCSPKLNPFKCQIPQHEALALTPVPFGDD